MNSAYTFYALKDNKVINVYIVFDISCLIPLFTSKTSCFFHKPSLNIITFSEPGEFHISSVMWTWGYG